MNKDKLKKVVIILGIAFITFIVVYFSCKEILKVVNKSKSVKTENTKVISKDSSFNIKIIKEINESEEKNYLISPYSIEYVLSMLRDGSLNNTKIELDNLIGNRKISNLRINKRVNVANGLFVRDVYKNSISNNYYNILKNKYNSDIIYDNFEKANTVNDWVNKETYEMIPSIIDEIPSDINFLIINALAIDVDWKYKFKCNSTQSYEFTRIDGSKYEISMMNQSYNSGAQFFEIDGAKGVILPYESYDKDGNVLVSDSNLEFIGILPDNNIKDYVSNLSDNVFKNIDDNALMVSSDRELLLYLPSFNYNYQVNDIITYLKKLGVNDLFNKNKANLKGISSSDLYVSQMIQKTYISLKEEGTRAAAVTGGMMGITSIPSETKKIVFDKPFVYMIRDRKTKELLFFGAVYEPNKWEGSTCQ